jgi:hypothetical protein
MGSPISHYIKKRTSMKRLHDGQYSADRFPNHSSPKSSPKTSGLGDQPHQKQTFDTVTKTADHHDVGASEDGINKSIETTPKPRNQ